jgi:hypothetical protein
VGADDPFAVQHLNYPMFHNIALPETTDLMFAEMIEALRPRVRG